MEEITLVVPSYQKIPQARQLVRAVQDTAIRDVGILFVVEEEENEEYTREFMREYRRGFVDIVSSNGKTLGSAFNRANPSGVYLGFINDDHHPRTKGWDEQIREELSSYPYSIVYPNDDFQRENLATAIFITRRLWITMPYVCPPSLDHLYIDNWWMDFGRRMPHGLRYRSDIIFEHMHPDAGKVADSEQYRRVNSHEAYAKDIAGYNEAIKNLDKDVNTTWDLIIEREFSSLAAAGFSEAASQPTTSALETTLLGWTRVDRSTTQQ